MTSFTRTRVGSAERRTLCLFEAIGAAVLVGGLIWSVVVASVTWRTVGGRRGYQALRETFGGVLLLGLEILVATDLIRTVAVSPTLRNVAVLGLIVLIRTFLSFSLQVEIDGQLPWRRSWPTESRPGKGSSTQAVLSLVTARNEISGNEAYRGRAHPAHRAGSGFLMPSRPRRAPW